MRSIVVVLGLIFSLSSFPARAAKITGKVVVTEEFREALAENDSEDSGGAKNYYWNQPNGIIGVVPPTVRADSDLAVVAFKEGADPRGPDDISSVNVRTGSLDTQRDGTRRRERGHCIVQRRVGPLKIYESSDCSHPE